MCGPLHLVRSRMVVIQDNYRLYPLKNDLFTDFYNAANSGTTDRIFAAGYDNGDVKVFDHRGNSYVWDVNVGSGVRHNPSAVCQVGPCEFLMLCERDLLGMLSGI